jgi:transposase
MIIRHMLTSASDYIWGRPALMARKLQLKMGVPANHARRGDAYDYNIPERRAAERAHVEEAEAVYQRFTERWRKRPMPKTAENAS